MFLMSEGKHRKITTTQRVIAWLRKRDERSLWLKPYTLALFFFGTAVIGRITVIETFGL